MLAMVLLAVVSCSWLAGCTGSVATGGKSYYQIPWPSSSGAKFGYSLQKVEIESFSSPESLEGSYAHILIDPFEQGGKLEGKSRGRFARVGDDLLVPMDFATLQATAVYAHFERLFRLDQAVGIADQLGWPLTIALHVNVIDENGAVKNNALYDGKRDALLVVPYSEKKLPISLNAGILAHEHFHKLFQTFVMRKISYPRSTPANPLRKAMSQACAWNLTDAPKPKADDNNKMAKAGALTSSDFNDFALRGMNEGFADFWGWVYTGDSSYISQSLGESESNRRRLDEKSVRMPSDIVWRLNMLQVDNQEERQELQVALAYEMGTYYARFLRALAMHLGGGKEDDADARLLLAKAMAETLPRLGDQLAQTTAKEQSISLNAPLIELYKHLPRVDQGACEMFDKFVAPESTGLTPESCRTLPTGSSATVPAADLTDLPKKSNLRMQM